jgi:hypothetical protein
VVGWTVDNEHEGVAMKTCSHFHDEVAFDDRTRKCPVCELKSELEDKIEDLKREIERLESELESRLP